MTAVSVRRLTRRHIRPLRTESDGPSRISDGRSCHASSKLQDARHDPPLPTGRGYDPAFDPSLALIVHRSTVRQIEMIDEDRRWSR